MTPIYQPGLLSIKRPHTLVWQSTAILVAVLSFTALWILRVVHTSATSPQFAFAVGASCALALAAWTLRAVTPAAAVTGALLSLSLCTAGPSGAGWWRSPLIPMLALFGLTHLATGFRRDRKEKVGLAEARRGRRASQVAANVGVAALVLPATAAHGWLPAILPCVFCAAPLSALVAALAEAAADTVSSEMGQALSGQPRMITTGRRVPPGTDGAVSPAGTLAGSIAAGIVVVVSMAVLDLSPLAGAIALAGAIFGLFFDSLLGATLERRGWLNNDAVNFFSTLAAAVMAGLLASVSRLAR